MGLRGRFSGFSTSRRGDRFLGGIGLVVRDRPRFPEIAKEVAAQDFDLFAIVGAASFNPFGAGIVQQAEANGRDIALVFVPRHQEILIPLPQPLFLVLEADVALLGVEQRRSRKSHLDQVRGIGREEWNGTI